jgi:hypothetical protein
MNTLKDQLSRIKESPLQRLARLSQHIPTTEAASTEPKAIEEQRTTIRLNPDTRAQMNVAIATTINPALADEQELEVHYKVLDPIHFFTIKADDLDRRPGQNDGQYRDYQHHMAKMWTDRFIKTHPEHSKGRIDRLSIHRKRKYKPPRRVEMATKTKGKRYGNADRKRILKWAANKSIRSAVKHYGVSSTTIHNWKTSSGVKRKSKAKVSIKRGSSLSVIRDLAQKLLAAVDKHREEMAAILSR